MKIRSGFVSNSSSSSFILALPKIPDNIQELKEMLLDDPDTLFHKTYDNELIPINEIVNVIFNDINSTNVGGPESFDTKIEISSYEIDNYDHLVTSNRLDRYKVLKSDYETTYEIHNSLFSDLFKTKDEDAREFVRNEIKLSDIELEKFSKEMIKIITESVSESDKKDYKYLSLEYADDTSIGSMIEHSGILDKITISRISHH